GRAIWLLPRGVRFNHHLSVVSNGDPDACLAIIAQKGVDPFTSNPVYRPSIWTFGGLDTSIPVILVSDNRVLLEQPNNLGFVYHGDKLPVFARCAYLSGPAASLGFRTTMSYDGTVGLGTMGAAIDTFLVHDALPNATPVIASTYPLVPGTWRVVQ